MNDNENQQKVRNELELVSDGEHLLVVGKKRRDVEKFLKAQGLLDVAQGFATKNLVPALRQTGDLANTVSEAVKESGMWLKLTEESAADVKALGLMDTKKTGVAHAMIGKRGDIKKWISIDVSATAKFTNPAVLTGIGTAMMQNAREQEAAQLRILLEKIDQKLDRVLRGQRDEIIGDLVGIERTIQDAMRARDFEGTVDQLTWSKLQTAPLLVRQVQAKALLKLDGIAADIEKKQAFQELRQDLDEVKTEVQSWLSVITRCAIAIDELTVFELDHYAQLELGVVENRRHALKAARDEDQVLLLESIAALMERMDAAAEEVDDHKLLHGIAVPKALGSLESAREAVVHFTEALGIDTDWENFDATTWIAAIREWQQWKNAGGEVGKVAVEKGGPVLGTILVGALTAIVTKKFPSNPSA